MAFYLNKREFFNGALTLYQRNLEVANPTQKTHKAPKWYYKVKLEGAKAATINKSTKLSSYEAAYAYAEQEYQRLFNAHRLGKTLEDWTFEQHWEDWYGTTQTYHQERYEWQLGEDNIEYWMYLQESYLLPNVSVPRTRDPGTLNPSDRLSNHPTFRASDRLVRLSADHPIAHKR